MNDANLRSAGSSAIRMRMSMYVAFSIFSGASQKNIRVDHFFEGPGKNIYFFLFFFFIRIKGLKTKTKVETNANAGRPANCQKTYLFRQNINCNTRYRTTNNSRNQGLEREWIYFAGVIWGLVTW